MEELGFNYVVFNMHDNKWKIDHNAYYTICVEDLFHDPRIIVVTWPLDYSSKFVRTLFNIHNSEKINQKIRLPLRKLWFPYYFKDKFKNNKPYCFIIVDYYYPQEYFNYLKRVYPDCKIVFLHRDLLSRFIPPLTNASFLDLEMTYDKNEAEIHKMIHFNEFESKINIPLCKDYPESDVYFAGNIKDRLEKVILAYKVFTGAGLKCKFYLVGVNENERVYLPGIEYGDSFIPYSEMLYHSVNSRCILEINQDLADGYTSRFLEAVMFNKRLITNNQSIKSSEFYNKDYIQIIEDFSKINTDFVTNNEPVDYHYSNQFSPVHLIEKIDNILSNKQ